MKVILQDIKKNWRGFALTFVVAVVFVQLDWLPDPTIGDWGFHNMVDLKAFVS